MTRPIKSILVAGSIVTVFALTTAPGAAASQGPVAWAVPSTLERIGPFDSPGTGNSAAIFAARGETQSFQIAVHAPPGGLSDVNLWVSDLKGPGGWSIPAADIILYREHYIKIHHHSPAAPPNRELPMKIFPDALIPFIDPATGKPPKGGKYKGVPFDLGPGDNGVIWADVQVPGFAAPGDYSGSYTVTSDQGTAGGKIVAHVWNFQIPFRPSLKSSFGVNQRLPGENETLLANRLMPDLVPPGDEKRFINRWGMDATDLGFSSGAYYGHCVMTPPPPVESILKAKSKHQPGVYLFDYSADEIFSCPFLFPRVKAWARNLHAAGIPNLITIEPVPELYDDGSGSGRSAVDDWVLTPQMYVHAQSYSKPRVTYVLKKGDSVWTYTALVQENYSPKWEIDFLPIDFRIMGGFVNQSLGETGLLYWLIDYWSKDPWTNIDYPGGCSQGQCWSYPGEGVLVYPGVPAGVRGVVPSMRLKYIRDSVDDYEFVQLLKNCGQGAWAIEQSRIVGADWLHWTRDAGVLESVRRRLGDRIAATGCAALPN